LAPVVKHYKLLCNDIVKLLRIAMRIIESFESLSIILLVLRSWNDYICGIEYEIPCSIDYIILLILMECAVAN